MTLELQVSVDAEADPMTVWDTLTDWAGQSRWIPLTTVTVVTPADTGVGVRASALSGFRLGSLPVGLLDRFVVTGWTPPHLGQDGRQPRAGELEVLHLGPYFTGIGVFRVESVGRRTRITATELFSLPGGRPVEGLVGLALPVMRAGFTSSLRALQKLVERQARTPAQHG